MQDVKSFADSYFSKEEKEFSKKANSVDDFATQYFTGGELKREPTPVEAQKRMQQTEARAIYPEKPLKEMKWQHAFGGTPEEHERKKEMFFRPMISQQTFGLSEHALPKKEPEGWREELLTAAGGLTGFITGAPLKVGGMVAKGLTKAAAPLLKKIGGKYGSKVLASVLQSSQTLGFGSALSEIEDIENMHKRFTSGAAMGAVFGTTAFLDFQKAAPFINNMLRQVGTRVLGNVTHTWDSDLLKKLASGRIEEIDSQQIFDELLFTYFSRHKVNKKQFFKDLDRINLEVDRMNKGAGRKLLEPWKPAAYNTPEGIAAMKKVGARFVGGVRGEVEFARKGLPTPKYPLAEAQSTAYSTPEGIAAMKKMQELRTTEGFKDYVVTPDGEAIPIGAFNKGDSMAEIREFTKSMREPITEPGRILQAGEPKPPFAEQPKKPEFFPGGVRQPKEPRLKPQLQKQVGLAKRFQEPESKPPKKTPVVPVEPRTKATPTLGMPKTEVPGKMALELKKKLGKEELIKPKITEEIRKNIKSKPIPKNKTLLYDAGLNLRRGIEDFNNWMEKKYGSEEVKISEPERKELVKEVEEAHKGPIWGLRTETNLRRFGKEGKSLADKGITYVKNRNQGEQADLFSLNSARKIIQKGMGVGMKEKMQHPLKTSADVAGRMWDLRERKVAPKNQAEKDSLEILDKLFETIEARSKKNEVEIITPFGKKKPFEGLENYMPREYKNLEEFLVSKKVEFKEAREIYINELAKEIEPDIYKARKELAIEKARKVFNSLTTDLSSRPMGHLERQRVLDDAALSRMETLWKKKFPGKKFPLTIKKTHDVLIKYFLESNERLAWIEQFGKDVETDVGFIPAEIKKVLGSMDNPSGKEFIRNFFRDFLNSGSLVSKKTTKIYRLVRTLQTSKLAMAFIPNSLQWFTNTMPLMSVKDIPGVFWDLAKQSVSKKAREKFSKTGAATFRQDFNMAALTDPKRVNDLSSLLLKLHGFSGTEFFNASFAAHAGKRKAMRLTKQLHKGKGTSWRSPYYIAELKKLGLNANDIKNIIEKGPYTEANVKELADAAYYLRRLTQFSADAFALPKYWSTPFGKLITQFKNFAYNQTALLWNEPIKDFMRTFKPMSKRTGEWKFSLGREGDITKLIKMAPALTFAGFLVTELKKKLYGRLGVHFYEELLEGKSKPMQLLMMAFNAGGFGIASDIIMSIPYGKTAFTGMVFGPTISDISNFTEALGKTIGEVSTQIDYTNTKWLSKRAETIATYWMKFGERISPDIRTILQAHFKKYKLLKTVNNWNTLYREARIKYRMLYKDKGKEKADQFWHGYEHTHGKEYEEVFKHPPNKPTEKEIENWWEDMGKSPVERISGVGTGKKGAKLPDYLF